MKRRHSFGDNIHCHKKRQIVYRSNSLDSIDLKKKKHIHTLSNNIFSATQKTSSEIISLIKTMQEKPFTEEPEKELSLNYVDLLGESSNDETF